MNNYMWLSLELRYLLMSEVYAEESGQEQILISSEHGDKSLRTVNVVDPVLLGLCHELPRKSPQSHTFKKTQNQPLINHRLRKKANLSQTELWEKDAGEQSIMIPPGEPDKRHSCADVLDPGLEFTESAGNNSTVFDTNCEESCSTSAASHGEEMIDSTHMDDGERLNISENLSHEDESGLRLHAKRSEVLVHHND